MPFYSHQDHWQPLYINGVKRMVTGLSGVIYADSDKLPNRRCSCHTLPAGAEKHFKNGGGIITSGCRFSLLPPKDQEAL